MPTLASWWKIPSASQADLVELTSVGLDGFGNSGVNTAINRTDGPTTDLVNNIQYAAYWNQGSRLVVGKRTPPSGAWTVDISGIDGTASDQHNFISMAVDGSGRLHVFADMHGDPMRYWRGTGPGVIHIAAWFPTPIAAGGAALEASVTYPQLDALPNGDLILFFRTGGSGEGNLVMYRWRDASNGGDDAWHIVHTNLVDGETLRSFYTLRPLYRNGRVQIAGSWRDTPAWNTEHDLLHFYLKLSDDFATGWKQDGSSQPLPVTYANAAYIAMIPANEGMVNTGTIALQADDVSPIVANWQDPGDGFTQYQLWFWDGAAWAHRWVPGIASQQEGMPFSTVDLTDTVSYFAICSPQILQRNGRFVLPFKSDGRGPGVWAWVCEEPTFQQFTLRYLNAVVVDEWAASIDSKAWNQSGDVFLAHQRAVRPGAPPIGAQGFGVLYWRPQVAPYVYVAPPAPWDPDSVPDCIFYGVPRVGGATVHGTLIGGDPNICNDILDARIGVDPNTRQTTARRYIQDTISDAPTYVYNAAVGPTSLIAAVRFFKATLDSMLCTVAAAYSALSGINSPFTIFLAVEPATLLAGDTFISYGNTAGSNQVYTQVCVGTDGSSLRVLRRAGAPAAVSAQTAAGALAVAVRSLFTLWFDGANILIRKDGQQILAPTPLGAAGNQAFTHGSIGCLVRSLSREAFGDFSLYTDAVYSRALTTTEMDNNENAIGAALDITITH